MLENEINFLPPFCVPSTTWFKTWLSGFLLVGWGWGDSISCSSRKKNFLLLLECNFVAINSSSRPSPLQNPSFYGTIVFLWYPPWCLDGSVPMCTSLKCIDSHLEKNAVLWNMNVTMFCFNEDKNSAWIGKIVCKEIVSDILKVPSSCKTTD